MKNLILTLALAVATTVGANAQEVAEATNCCATTTTFENTKGDWYIGTGDITNTAWTELSISPTIGYAFADNYMVGMSLSQADSTADLELGLSGRYFYKGFFGYASLADFDFERINLGVGKMFTLGKNMYIDPRVVYNLGEETTNLQIGFGLRF